MRFRSLTPAEKTTLNQIRGHEYLAMFGLVEEFILPYVVDHARPQLSGDDYRVRALLGFAGEEAKHIHLFKRFREEFEEGFGSKCEFIGPAEDVTKFVLSHSPLGVAFAILHIEWMTLDTISRASRIIGIWIRSLPACSRTIGWKNRSIPSSIH